MTFPSSGDEAPATSGGQPPPENRNPNRGETMLGMTSKGRTVLAVLTLAALSVFAVIAPATAFAKGAHHGGGEASLALPNLGSVTFAGGINGHTLLLFGLIVCALGMAFGIAAYAKIRGLPVHQSMAEISDLIYETCKTYLLQQGKFLLLLWVFIGAIVLVYFGSLAVTGVDAAGNITRGFPPFKVAVILFFSLVGMAGSYSVAWFGIRINTFANSRTAFSALTGKPFGCYSIPLQAGMSIGMALISVELLIMLIILLFVPGDMAGPCFIGFAIGESLGAAALRIAGGIFTKIADIGSGLVKIVFKIKEDDARNPGAIADCTGDNAGDSVGPSADGFETYGVTGVALITFILLAVVNPTVQTQLLVRIFAIHVLMIVTAAVSPWINPAIASSKNGSAHEMNFEAPLTTLVWLTSIVSVVATYVVSYLLVPDLGDGSLWWKLSTIITC